MKALAALVFLGLAAPALAAPTPVLVGSPRYVCERGPLTHAALKADPAPCCAGMFGCPQLLSNTGLVKPKRDNRT